jgi:hypothetical protein
MTARYTKPSNNQAQFIERCRDESCIDPSVPLGFMFPPRAEFGLSVGAYFRWKHSPAGPGAGRYFPLHDIADPKDRHARST